MVIRVAVHAAIELDLVTRFLPLGDVTLAALQLRVAAFQGISGCCMLLNAEG